MENSSEPVEEPAPEPATPQAPAPVEPEPAKPAEPKRRGRPPGSKNKPKVKTVPVEEVPASAPESAHTEKAPPDCTRPLPWSL